MKKVKELLKKIGGFIGKVWKKGTWGKVVVVAGGIYIMGMVGSIFSPTPTPTPSETKPSKEISHQITEQVEEEKKEPTAEEKAVEYVKEVLGKDFISCDKGVSNILIQFKTPDLYKNSQIKDMYKMKVVKVLKGLKGSEYLEGVETVDFMTMSTFVNVYGEKSEGKALASSFKVSDIERVNFENVISKEFCDNFDIGNYVHPALRGDK